jgi:hypothetical protein
MEILLLLNLILDLEMCPGVILILGPDLNMEQDIDLNVDVKLDIVLNLELIQNLYIDVELIMIWTWI